MEGDDGDEPVRGVCAEFQDCDLLEQGCQEPGWGCYPNGRGDGVCWPPRARGAAGEICELAHDCDVGLTCNTEGVCVALCEIAASDCSCLTEPGLPDGVGTCETR
jgi:hypothetical protein